MRKLFSIFKRKKVKEDEYNVIKCETKFGIHYEIWKNGSQHLIERNTKFGKRMYSKQWKSYRMATRVCWNRHNNF